MRFGIFIRKFENPGMRVDRIPLYPILFRGIFILVILWNSSIFTLMIHLQTLIRASFGIALLMLGLTSSVHAQTETLCIYETFITPEDRVNSRGIALKDPRAILVQNRANTHRKGGDDYEEYFATMERRAQIPGMLDRGEFSEPVRNAVLHGDSPFLRIEVFRDPRGVTSMKVKISAYNPDDHPEGDAGLD
jgi:hypothetical protein